MSFVNRIPRRLMAPLAAVAVLTVAGVLQMADANPAASQTTMLRAWESKSDPGLDPSNKAWNDATPIQVPLSAQAGSYFAGGGSIPVVSAKALHHGGTLYVRVEWDDKTNDESTTRVQDFADAVALEFPATAAVSTPSICMGQADSGVNIWHWRADSQAGLKDPDKVYANALVDTYPSTEDLFYTARAAGNPFAQPDAGPVQNLTAQAFGNLTKATVQDIKGEGVYKDGKWSVVFARPFGSGGAEYATFNQGTQTDMAIAVWNGSEGDRNGSKAVSQFLTLNISPAFADNDGGSTWVLWGAAAVIVGILGLGIALGLYGYREGGR